MNFPLKRNKKKVKSLLMHKIKSSLRKFETLEDNGNNNKILTY